MHMIILELCCKSKMFAINASPRNESTILEGYQLLLFQGRQSRHFSTRWVRHGDLCTGVVPPFKAFASQNSVKKGKYDRTKTKSKSKTLPQRNLSSEKYELVDNSTTKDDSNCDFTAELSSSDVDPNSTITRPTRSAVLQACVLTSGLLLSLGAVIRQASHFASMEGWEILNSYREVSFDFEVWHIELIIGMVIFISSCRYILLKTWPDFSKSSEASNQQVLSSLQPLDYVVVAFLPGISEELLFRGALMPFFGLNWKSALAVGAVFGGLHLGSGRKYSFAIWATFVGFAYGLATIISSSVIVPMASHSLNNLVGGILWRYTSSQKETNE